MPELTQQMFDAKNMMLPGGSEGSDVFFFFVCVCVLGFGVIVVFGWVWGLMFGFSVCFFCLLAFMV